MPYGANLRFLNTGGLVTATFTSSGTFTVPAYVFCLDVQIAPPGAGGGGGNSTPGGGGGGGGSGVVTDFFPYFVNPSDVITVTVGAFGTGGAPNVSGTSGGACFISGSSVDPVQYRGLPSGGGIAGGAVNGGNGGDVFVASGGVGGAGVGGNAAAARFVGMPTINAIGGAAGGALNFNGGVSQLINAYFNNAGIPTAGLGGAAGGGGGCGGGSPFGFGGRGGSNGSAGSSPAFGYSAGGGGGSGNAAGADGAPGFIRFQYYVPAARVQ